MSLRDNDDDLNELQCAAVRHLTDPKGQVRLSMEQLAGYLRYKGRTSLDNLKDRPDLVLGSKPSRRLARLASDYGFDQLGASYLAEEKVPVPVTGSHAGDGCSIEELRAVVEGTGALSVNDRLEQLDQVEICCDQVIRACVSIKADVKVKRRRVRRMGRAGAKPGIEHGRPMNPRLPESRRGVAQTLNPTGNAPLVGSAKM